MLSSGQQQAYSIGDDQVSGPDMDYERIINAFIHNCSR